MNDLCDQALQLDVNGSHSNHLGHQVSKWCINDRSGGMLTVSAQLLPQAPPSHCQVELRVAYVQQSDTCRRLPARVSVDVHGAPLHALLCTKQSPKSQTHAPEDAACGYRVHVPRVNENRAHWHIEYSSAVLLNSTEPSSKCCVLRATFRVLSFPFVLQVDVAQQPQSTGFKRLLGRLAEWQRAAPIHMQIVRSQDLANVLCIAREKNNATSSQKSHALKDEPLVEIEL